MGRFALVALFVLPNVALAQRVEIAVFAGASQSIPRTTSTLPLCCPFRPDDRWSIPTVVTRGMRSMIGSRLTVQIGRHFGVDAMIHHSRGTNEARFDSSVTRREVTATFAAIQAHGTAVLSRNIEAVFGAGPAAAELSYVSGDVKFGASFSLGLRAQFATGVTLNVGVTDTHLLGPPAQGHRNHLAYGVSVGYAMIR